MQPPSYCEGQDKVEDYMKQTQKKKTQKSTLIFWKKNVVRGTARPDSFFNAPQTSNFPWLCKFCQVVKSSVIHTFNKYIVYLFCVPVLRKGSTGGLLEMLFVMLFTLSKDLITLICQGRRIAAFYQAMKRLKCPSIGFLSGLFCY